MTEKENTNTGFYLQNKIKKNKTKKNKLGNINKGIVQSAHVP